MKSILTGLGIFTLASVVDANFYSLDDFKNCPRSGRTNCEVELINLILEQKYKGKVEVYTCRDISYIGNSLDEVRAILSRTNVFNEKERVGFVLTTRDLEGQDFGVSIIKEGKLIESSRGKIPVKLLEGRFSFSAKGSFPAGEYTFRGHVGRYTLKYDFKVIKQVK